MKSFFILFLVFSTFLFKNLKSFLEEEVITTITSDDESALKQATFYLWKQGGYIYIDTPVITITQGSLSITGTLKGGLIGKMQPNGEYPRLNFKEQRESSTNIYTSGIDVVGSNKIIQNIIVENAGTFGIFINGQKNTIDNVITRYNGESGIYISKDSDFNTFNYCFSYRNFLLPKNNRNADGFTIEEGTNNNIFNNCFAWDNSQNGFGYKNGSGKIKSEEITYNHCASWNNGNIEVFSGKYDLENGNKLDKNLWTVQEILKSDENFEKNYENKEFNLEKAKINNISAIEFFAEYKKEGCGNGFILGNGKNEDISINRRVLDYCVSFDHIDKGYSSNTIQNLTVLLTNCVGFNNNMNYELAFSFEKWSNNWSWDSKEKDIFAKDEIVKNPNDINSAKKEFYSIRDKIIYSANWNSFLDINFDRIIKGLKK